MSQASLPFESLKQADWEDLNIPFNIGTGRTIYGGAGQDDRLVMRFFRRSSDNHVLGYVRYGQGTDGPPGHAHGGISAYVLDEAMGTVSWMNLFPVVAAELKFKYLQMVPLHSDILIEAWVSSISSRRIVVQSQLKLASGLVCVTGEGQFAILKKSKVLALLNHLDKSGKWQNSGLKWIDDDPR